MRQDTRGDFSIEWHCHCSALTEVLMSVPTLSGITPKMIATERITTRVLFSGPDDGLPVLFLHGNALSATWWEETMVALPALPRHCARPAGLWRRRPGQEGGCHAWRGRLGRRCRGAA